MKSAVKGYGHCSKHLHYENTVYGVFFYQIKGKVFDRARKCSETWRKWS